MQIPAPVYGHDPRIDVKGPVRYGVGVTRFAKPRENGRNAATAKNGRHAFPMWFTRPYRMTESRRPEALWKRSICKTLGQEANEAYH